MANQDELMQKTTFTLTNVAPQYGNFNQQAWNHLECMTKQYLELEIPGEYAHVMTGTYGIKEVLNQESEEKNELSVPEFYWKAFCYEGNGEIYSWAYIQENDDSQKVIDEKNFMLVSEFSKEYYQGEHIFD